MIFNQNCMGEDSLTRDIELLKNGDDETREDSARRLGDYREKEAVDALYDALHDTNEDVVEEALASLGRIGNPDAVDKIVPVLSHDDIGIRRS
ncbi:HEAT repeat domain-containing protein, partial [Arthrospira platensis SPKY1]|nr:HEAT repeat domain-containing protein [Arthrospira platensis SPKY1]